MCIRDSHTDADLDIQGLHVPAGDYTLFVNVADPDHWEFIVSKDTKEWGLAYKDNMDAVSYTHLDVYKRQAQACDRNAILPAR